MINEWLFDRVCCWGRSCQQRPSVAVLAFCRLSVIRSSSLRFYYRKIAWWTTLVTLSLVPREIASEKCSVNFPSKPEDCFSSMLVNLMMDRNQVDFKASLFVFNFCIWVWCTDGYQIISVYEGEWTQAWTPQCWPPHHTACWPLLHRQTSGQQLSWAMPARSNLAQCKWILWYWFSEIRVKSLVDPKAQLVDKE